MGTLHETRSPGRFLQALQRVPTFAHHLVRAESPQIASENLRPLTGRLDAEAGYGLGAFGGRGVMTPFAGLSLSDAGVRTWRSGVRWTLGPDLSFGVEGASREAGNENAAEHEIGFKLTARF